MKKIIYAAVVAMAFLAAPRTTEAQEISFGVFYSSLAPYGHWVRVGTYGMCWQPVGMRQEWAPYTSGHWVWTEYGWTWVSNYPWGWAPFHYGRWVYEADYGWIWAPGYVWAPAWVQWRWGGGYCGWAPLPPGFHFRLDVVIGPDDRDFGVGPRGWNFVRADDIGMHRYNFINRDDVPRVIARTRNVTRFRFTARGVFDIGLQRQEVERVTRRRIQTVSITRTNEIGRQRIAGNQIRIYSPAPFEPRFRNEGEVIRRERTYSVPQRYGSSQPQRYAPPRETPRPPRTRQYQPPRLDQRNVDTVHPRPNPKQRSRGEVKQHEHNDKSKGPVRHR